MDLTQDNFAVKNRRAKIMMLAFGIVSMVMMFAGLTSAYVVSKSRPDWIENFELPSALYWSTLVIVISSITMIFAKKEIKNGNRSAGSSFLMATFGLGVAFVVLQFIGFNEIIASGYYLTGSESTVTTSFLYVIVISHLVHLFAGLIVLLVVIYNHFKQRYTSSQMLGLELGAIFWHFVDALWIYLFLFLYFVR